MNLFKMLYAKFSKESFAKASLMGSESFLESEGEDFQVGFPVYLVENNEPKLVESMMDFMLEDGRTIKTDETGLISEILLPETEDESEVEIKIEVETESEDEVETEVEDEVETESEVMMLKKQVEELSTMLASMKEDYKSLNEKVEAMYKAPIEPKQKFKSEDYSKLTPGQKKLINTIN